MAGSRANAAQDEPDAPKAGSAPTDLPLPFFVQRAAAAEEESSGDEVCFNHHPLVAVQPRSRHDESVADRGALARAKMQTLGCAKKDRKVPDEEKKGASKPITSVATRCVPADPEIEQRSGQEEAPSDSDDGGAVFHEELPWRRSSWWAQFFQLKVTPGLAATVASLKVSLARLSLSDVDMPSITAALERLLSHLRDEDLLPAATACRAPVRLLLDLDLSDNDISDVGAVWLFNWLSSRSRPQEVRCRTIRLARNRLGDVALEWLSALVCQQHSALEELHLAENAITATGAAHLLLSFALHPFEAYPFLDPRGFFAPASVSLDRNPIHEPGLLARLRLRSNLRAACKDGNLRSSNFNSTPHVQLGAAFPDEATRSSTVLPLALEKVCAGGAWPSLPQLPRPQVKETSGSSDEAVNGQLPKGKTFRRELLVDDEEGAGLELETVSEGLRICEIMQIPGQPGLQLGDVIVAIDGLPLWWSACLNDQVEIDEDDDAPSARFRARFRRGARLDVLRATLEVGHPKPGSRPAAGSKKRFACPVCWDTFDLWNDCLQHLREFGHEPPMPLPSSTKKLEDASGSLRRWMATCMAAARGELGAPAPSRNGSVSAEKWMAIDEQDKAETLLLPASIGVLGERNRMVVEALAEEASRFGFEQGCTVWTLASGLRAQCREASRVASLAEQLLQIMHFYLPDVDDKEVPGEEDEELAEWTAWLEQMLQQQAEETRNLRWPQPSISSTRPPEDLTAPPPSAATVRLLLLCGLPGSGKSTLAQSFAQSSQWCVVNQDTLGSRQACMKVARHGLSRGRNVVIDRCNVTRAQRGIWTLLASEFNLSTSEVGCVWLDVSREECSRRVMQRFGHRTLPPREASVKVIHSFAQRWEAPNASEGLGPLWRLASEADQDVFLAEFGLTRHEGKREAGAKAAKEVSPTEAPASKEPEPSPPPEAATRKEKEPEPAPPPEAATRKEKVGSNKILAPVELPLVEETGGHVTHQAPSPGTWTCSCGEINKRRREVCNNCFAAQPAQPCPPPRTASPATASPEVPAVAEDSSPALAETEAKLNAAISGLGPGAVDFWRLPLEDEDLSPP